jgi:hypothetical protein
MPSLSRDLRNQLARVTLEARELAEKACRAALENLAVHEKDYRGHMTVEQRQLRNRLRARGRALGDRLDQAKGTQEIKHLAEDAAYENWHRLLFTRFLAENSLLHTSKEHGQVPVTLMDCEELAPELGAKDGFDLACRFAGEILPGVFRRDDPVFEVQLAQRDVAEMRRLLDTLPAEVFTADDALGWTYQFWQARRKDEVNAAGNKIGADELPAVTQLFTEDYMVEFLLHNTLGAWWAGKLGPITADDEAGARAKAALPLRDGLAVEWTYLRFIQNETTKQWSPAAGTFDGWPREAAKITFLDPCMGSGHFPVFALSILARLRMEEEKFGAAAALTAVLRDNIFGLELDPRCTQIGAFNLALAAWKLGGYQELPPLHVACSGLAPYAKESDWVALAGDNDKLRRGMERLYRLFKDAPVLGSLINPRATGGDLLEAGFQELQPLLEKALAQEGKDDTAHELAVTAQGVAKAAEILAGQFTLVATNVPYLGFQKQDEVLVDYCERVHPDAKADLATCFVERCLKFCCLSSSTALVTPQNWLFLNRLRNLRKFLLEKQSWHVVARLGEHGFNSPQAAGAFTAMVVLSPVLPSGKQALAGLDVADKKSPDDKAAALLTTTPVRALQSESLRRPDSTVSFEERSSLPLLSEYADSLTGAHTLDIERFRIYFWELECVTKRWNLHASTPVAGKHYSGMEYVSYTREKGEAFANLAAAMKEEGFLGGWLSGNKAWGKSGIACSWMRQLPASLYLGTVYDNSAAVIIPHKNEWIPAVWCFCSSAQYSTEVRKINQKVQVANSTLVKVPFDLTHWQKVAAEKYPHGLPKPFSSDPTQWLFEGHPAGADQPLHVAVARLLGYQWPRQTGSSFPDCPALKPDGLEKLADNDGIVCLPPLNREQPAAARLRNLLASGLSSFDERTLLNAADAKKTTLEDWLRDEFFEQHCALFHHRPFIWHIWDGRKDGFAALINYHRLDHANLQKLSYTYLGGWINDQEAAAKADTPGAAERLLAAQQLQQELAKILEGDPPYDIFVRWKPLGKQARGWNPDINDGVRLNIRPFLLAKDVGKKGAGILRTKPNIKWDKDRGKEPQRPKNEYPWFWCEEEPGTDPTDGKTFQGHRWNNVHLTLAMKSA